jgi:exodeoxyribonuclease-5
MVDEAMGRDLESFGCQILVLGDPAQLPPVYGAGYFTNQEPDFVLTEIHRQAQGSPILALADMVRHQRLPEVGTYGDCRVLTRMDSEMALAADQMLVGRNETRRSFNARVRQLKGCASLHPVAGDKLVCLRNSRDNPLLNGSLWNVQSNATEVNEDTLMLDLAAVEDGEEVSCLAHAHHFRGDKLPWWAKNDAEEFDYGYALTTHKAQGSQWDDVLVYDESSAFRQDKWRWLYTAITRAARRCDIVRGG